MFDDPRNMRLYAACEKVGLPVMFHLTKMDRERADFDRVVDAVCDFARADAERGRLRDAMRAEGEQVEIKLSRESAADSVRSTPAYARDPSDDV